MNLLEVKVGTALALLFLLCNYIEGNVGNVMCSSVILMGLSETQLIRVYANMALVRSHLLDLPCLLLSKMGIKLFTLEIVSLRCIVLLLIQLIVVIMSVVRDFRSVNPDIWFTTVAGMSILFFYAYEYLLKLTKNIEITYINTGCQGILTKWS